MEYKNIDCIVSESLKDRAFHIRTVYVNSLEREHPNGIVWRLGNPQFRNASRVVS